MIDAPMNAEVLEEMLKRNQDTEIVTLLAERLNVGTEEALRIYYSSRLSEQINEGAYGIQYMDPAYLVEDLLENEPEVAAIGECSQ
ncbi:MULTISPECIES: hypothetical protein [Adlercreutzia]|uniref:hypothetical protein n=1 Tax=Adlercreutzia TaxID=447020 RepID=UPI00242CD210|nr:hypothetical protein [Adlercreutzia equolifaciens]